MREYLRTHKREILMAYAQIFIGSVIGAAAYPTFLIPNNIAPGGLTGVATILNYLAGWPVGITALVLNIPLFLIGYRTMGKVFAFRSLVATALFTILIDILPLKPVSEDPLLGTLFGGVVLGIGLGLILRGGATTGGSDMVARLVHRRFSFITVGMFLFALDFLVVLAAAIFIGGTMLVLAPSSALGKVFAIKGMTHAINAFFLGISTNRYVILTLIFGILFLAGMFVQTSPCIVILGPILYNVAASVGIDIIHFGIIMILALSIAFVTPPVASNLFVASSMTGLPIDRITRPLIPFIIGLVLCLFIVGFVPQITWAFVNLFS